MEGEVKGEGDGARYIYSEKVEEERRRFRYVRGVLPSILSAWCLVFWV
jgi:hypothetical protein